MKRGVPPTPLNARTGEWTPPGTTCLDLSKSFSDSFVMFCSTVLSQPFLRMPGPVSDDHRRAGAGECCPRFDVRARAVGQSPLGQELDRSVFAADFVNGP